MSTSQPPAVDSTTREMVAAVQTFVEEVMRDLLRMEMQGGEAATHAYAHACMENLAECRLPALVAAHDDLAAALNAASPEAPPILSLTTLRPA